MILTIGWPRSPALETYRRRTTATRAKTADVLGILKNAWVILGIGGPVGDADGDETGKKCRLVTPSMSERSVHNF